MTNSVNKSANQAASKRRVTTAVKAGSVTIGGNAPIAIQSMAATKTQNIEATLEQVKLLEAHGADLIRIAIDSKRDVEALKDIRKETEANLVIDLQESYKLVEQVAPLVQKIRYNPGHLHHHQKEIPVEEKVKFIVDHAGAHNCAVRIGVNFGSLDPQVKEKFEDPKEVALSSVDEHMQIMDKLGFSQFVVSLKSSDPNAVIEINKEFAKRYHSIPLHLGVTEAGMLPMGGIKTRIAFENLLALGIGDTVRASLTLPFVEKYKELEVARSIIEDVQAGRFRSVPKFEQEGLNIISCPSCSRVENEAFIELAEQVKEMSAYAAKENITIAVMGCRVNGPGETDEADLGLWCAPTFVNLKKKEELIGKFGYDEIIPKLKEELDLLLNRH